MFLAVVPKNVFANSVEPRVSVIPCPNCSRAIQVFEERTFKHDESFSCVHGYSSGKDFYHVYEVKAVGNCSNCGHMYEHVLPEDHVIYYCENGAI